MDVYDIIIIGGGQSGLAMGYYLRRTGLSFVILDNQNEPGGAWCHTWKSLRLFSPAQWSSLPGMIMNGGTDYYPTRDEAIEYLKAYESKYHLPVRRQIEVTDVRKVDERFHVETSIGILTSIENDLLSVTVKDSLAVRADVFATAIMVMGLDSAKSFVDKMNIDAFIVYQENGKVLSWNTPNFLNPQDRSITLR